MRTVPARVPARTIANPGIGRLPVPRALAIAVGRNARKAGRVRIDFHDGVNLVGVNPAGKNWPQENGVNLDEANSGGEDLTVKNSQIVDPAHDAAGCADDSKTRMRVRLRFAARDQCDAAAARGAC